MLAEVLLGLLVSAGCPSENFNRDWEQYPATLRIENTAREIYAVGDVHGDFNNFYSLLLNAKVISGPAVPTASKFEWNAGSAIFVQVGDLINKGEDSLDVLEFSMNLEEKARRAGGSAVFLAGNHEVGFISAPFDPKYEALRTEVESKKLSLCPDVHSPFGPKGKWLHNRPAAAIVNGIFFSHSGYTPGISLAEIANQYENFVDTNNWDSGFMCGSRDFAKTTLGFFNANDWWGNSGEVLDAGLKSLNAKQVAFGHDPNVFKSRGEILSYLTNSIGRALTKLDVGMWQGDSNGSIYHCSVFFKDGGCAQPERLMLPMFTESRGTKTVPAIPLKFEPVPQRPELPPLQNYKPPKGRC